MDAAKSLEIQPVIKYFNKEHDDFQAANAQIKSLQPEYDKLLVQLGRLKCFAPYKSGAGCSSAVKAVCTDVGKALTKLDAPPTCSMRFQVFPVGNVIPTGLNNLSEAH